MKFLPLLFTLITSVITVAAEFSLPDNRAKILESEQIQVSLEGTSTDTPKAKIGLLSAVVPTGLYQSVALEVRQHFKRAGIHGTAFTGAYAINPFKTFDFGASLTYLTFEDTHRHHNGTASLGVNYRFPLHSLLGEHHLGLYANNVACLPSKRAQGLLDPSTVKVGWEGNLLERRLKLNAALGGDLKSKDVSYELGLQFRPLIFDVAAKKSEDAWELYGGVHLLNLDVGASYEKRDDYTLVHVGFTKRFRRNREDRFSFLFRPRICIPPSVFYTKAIRFLLNSDYLNALGLLSRISREPHNFFKLHEVEALRAQCFQQLGFYEIAQKIAFESLLNSIGDEQYRAYAYGILLEEAVRNLNEDLVMGYHENVYMYSSDDSLKYFADLKLGEYYLCQNDFANAYKVFVKIPVESKVIEDVIVNLKVLSYLKDNGLEFNVINKSGMGEDFMGHYLRLGQEVYELYEKEETSYTLQKLNLLEKDILNKYERYKSLLDPLQYEKKRILNLAKGETVK